MILTIILILAAVVGIGLLGGSRIARNKDDRMGLLGVGTAVLVLTGIVFLATSFTYVEARTVGITTAFGKPTGAISNGLSFTAPWVEVHRFPTDKQSLDLDSTDGSEGNVAIKFAGGGAGNVNLNVTWRVLDDNKAVKLFENWKTFDRVKNDLVGRNTPEIVNIIFGSYSPEDAVKGESIGKISDQVKTKLNDRFAADGITVDTVSIKRVDPSSEIQSRINRQVQAQADVETARIEQERAKIDNETNKLREQSLTEKALVNKCLDIVNTWDTAKNGQLPATFTCGLGANGQVLIQGK